MCGGTKRANVLLVEEDIVSNDIRTSQKFVWRGYYFFGGVRQALK